MKGLHTLKPARGSRRTKRRVGRGNSSGRGTYSGRGMKGQRARAGGRSGIIARSMRSYLMRIPKARGFSRKGIEYTIVHLQDLQKVFEAGAVVSLKQLRAKGLIDKGLVKILSRGELSKKLSVSAHAFSAQAKAAIEKAGGVAEIIALAQPKKGKK